MGIEMRRICFYVSFYGTVQSAALFRLSVSWRITASTHGEKRRDPVSLGLSRKRISSKGYKRRDGGTLATKYRDDDLRKKNLAFGRGHGTMFVLMRARLRSGNTHLMRAVIWAQGERGCNETNHMMLHC